MAIRNSIRRLIVCGSFAALAGIAAAQPTGVIGYDLIEIPPLEGDLSSSVGALDNFGRVLGRSSNAPSTPFVWINGRQEIIPPPPGYRLVLANDIGSGGVIVGRAAELENSRIHAFAWTADGGIHRLDLIPGATSNDALAVDDQPWPDCVIGGTCGFTLTYATLWRGTTATQLGGPRSAVGPVNTLGHAVGVQHNDLFNVQRPVLWRDGQMIDIGGDPPNQSGGAGGVNEWTEVVGNFPDARRPFRWYDGSLTLLPRLYPCNTVGKAWAINDAGLIAGVDGRADCRYSEATVWERLTPIEQVPAAYAAFDLNNHIPRHPGVTLLDAKDINDAGQIAAYGDNVDGDGRGYLVTPYLFEMSDPAPGRAGTQNTITVTGLQPDQRLVLVWGTQEGAQKIRPSCPGGTLLIRDPHALPMVRADENGVATFTMFIPPYARGRTIRMQAIAPFECEISHTVTWTFE